MNEENQVKSNYYPEFKPMKKGTLPNGKGPRDLVVKLSDGCDLVRTRPAKPGSRREKIINVLIKAGTPLTQTDMRKRAGFTNKECSGLFTGMYTDQLLQRRNDGWAWLYWPAAIPWPEEEKQNADDSTKIETASIKTPATIVPVTPKRHGSEMPAGPDGTDTAGNDAIPLADETDEPAQETQSAVEPCFDDIELGLWEEDPFLEFIEAQGNHVFPDAAEEAKRLRALAAWKDFHPEISKWLLTVAEKIEVFA